MDKLLHFLSCYFITSVFSIINPLAGVLIALAAGIGKEVYDWFKYGKDMSWKVFGKMAIGDLIADVGGILIYILIRGVAYGA